MKRDSKRSREIAEKLEAAGRERLSPEHRAEMVGGICTSMASFIAAIDSDSRNVRDYIRQRIGDLLIRHVPIDELEECAKDGRQLASPAGLTPGKGEGTP